MASVLVAILPALHSGPRALQAWNARRVWKESPGPSLTPRSPGRVCRVSKESLKIGLWTLFGLLGTLRHTLLGPWGFSDP